LKRGYTLIEILAVIIILGIVIAISIPIVGTLIRNSQEDAFRENQNALIEAAKTYQHGLPGYLSQRPNEIIFLSLKELKVTNHIEDIVDPKTKVSCDENASGVAIKRVGESDFIYESYLKCDEFNTENTTTLPFTSITATTLENIQKVTIKYNQNEINAFATEKNIIDLSKVYKPTLLDYSIWQLNTSGSQGNFSKNGETYENKILLGTNPWGRTDILWVVNENDANSNADGGWNVTGLPIDKTKTYRLSVWIKRENVGDGRSYFGCQKYTVKKLAANPEDETETNPYFYSGLISHLPQIDGNWTLWVAHIHPYDYTGGTSSQSGIYATDGTKIRNINNDYKWASDATYGGHRSFLYYSTKTDEIQYFYRPRFEVVDANTPSIQDLIRGVENTDLYNCYLKAQGEILCHYEIGTHQFTMRKSSGEIYRIYYTIR
jgi:prepilin-type N-terminal cleavage/methylation domain-containing protein